MGFSALLNREDVYQILSDTLCGYYSERFPEQRIYVGYEKKDNSRSFIIVPEFGMIMPPFPNKKIRQHYYESYNIRNNLPKNIVAKLLIFAATHLPFSITTKKKLYISPKTIVNESTVFAYCNRSIRIFDFLNCISVSIQKESFSDYYFKKQLEFRLTNPYLFIPEIKESSKNWFVEPLLKGHMLARETDQKRFLATEEKALILIDELSQTTKRTEEITVYSSVLLRLINSQIDRAIKEKGISSYRISKKIISCLERGLAGGNRFFTSVLSHGDFQAGNIWVSTNTVYLIDWETVGRRSAWFDTFTLKYGTRYYGGIKNLVLDAKCNSLHNKCISEENKVTDLQMLALFLLEDIEFYLEDMLELPGESGRDTYDRYISELAEVDWDSVFPLVNVDGKQE